VPHKANNSNIAYNIMLLDSNTWQLQTLKQNWMIKTLDTYWKTC